MGVLFRISRSRTACVLLTASVLVLCPLAAQQDPDLQQEPAAPQDWEAIIAEGDQALAERDFDRARRLLSSATAQAREFPAADPRQTQSLVRLARFHRAEGDFAKPEDLYREAAESGVAAWGRESQEYAELLNEIGRYYHTRRKYDLADGFYLDAFSIRVRLLGREHLKVAESINNMAVLYENQARFSKSETYYRTALAIRTKLLGDEALPTIETKEHLARLLLSTQRPDEAQSLLEQARAVRRPLLDKYTAQRVELPNIVSGGPSFKPPELELQSDPEYSPEGRISRQEGAVSLEIEIDAEGVPRNVRVLRILGLGLDEMAVDAVREWRFKPARLKNKKVACRAVLDISFRLL